MKRIISIVLTMAMLLAMVVTTPVSAATTTTAEPYDIVKWDGTIVTDNKGTVSTVPVISGNLYPTGGITTTKYQISVLQGGTGTGLSTVKSSDNEYYSVDYSSDLRYDPSTNFNFYAQVTSAKLNKPVFSVMYDIMIPAGDNEDSARKFTPTFASTNAKSGATGENPAQFTIKYENKKFSIDNTADLLGFDKFSAVYAEEDYTPGTWVTVEVRAYYDATTKKLTYGAYVDDTRIFYGEGNIEYSAMYLDKALWSQPSVVTNYDNICMRVLAVEDKPTTSTSH